MWENKRACRENSLWGSRAENLSNIILYDGASQLPLGRHDDYILVLLCRVAKIL